VIRVAVLVSGAGSNMEAIVKAQMAGRLPGANVVLVISSKAGVQALDRAARAGVKSMVIERPAFPDDSAFEAATLEALREENIDIVCLAGYLKKIGPEILRTYHGRILNIHPALLPKFGGPGMYGHYVHEAVLSAGEKMSGCTVHLVDEEFDRGPVLAQSTVPVLPGDTPETLAARVLEQEHKLYPKVVREFSEKLIRSGAQP